MPKFTTDSKFLSHNDISDVEDTIVTIKTVEREVVGQGTQASEKWICYFKEIKKGLVLNKTNGKTLCNILGSEEMEDWAGQKVALYVKDDVEYQGEIVSAIRVRSKLPSKSAAKAAPAQAKANITADDIMTKLNVAESTKEVMGLMREIVLAELSDQDRDDLTTLADQRMDEIKRASK